MITANKCVCCQGTNFTFYNGVVYPFIIYRLTGIKGSFGGCRSVVCKDCGVIFMGYRYTDDEFLKIYNGYRNEEYIKERTEDDVEYSKKNDWFSKRVPYMDAIENLIKPFVKLPVTVLDWGGDTGHNAPFEDDRSLLHVYDIGDNEVIEGALKIDQPEDRYDLVVCANVLEHVSYPVEILKEIVRTMDSHSVLYIEVPDEQIGEIDLQVKDYLLPWHEHINYFSPRSIGEMLDAAGLNAVNVSVVSTKITKYDIKQFLVVAKLKDKQ